MNSDRAAPRHRSRHRRRRRRRARAGDARWATSWASAAAPTVTLIDKNRTHVWKPKLHEIASGSMDMSAHEVDYLAQAHWHHFRFRIGEMTGAGPRAPRGAGRALRRRRGPRRSRRAASFGYDTLVICVGSLSNDFGTPGVREHALKLESKADARRFHARMVNACIRAHAQTDAAAPGAAARGDHRRRRHRRRARGRAASHDARGRGLRARPRRRRQGHPGHLIEAADRVLPALPPRMSQATEELLRKLGVVVHTARQGGRGARPTACAWPTAARLPAELVVWAAGVKAPTFLKDIAGLETNRINQLVVRPTLQTTRDDDIFVDRRLRRLRLARGQRRQGRLRAAARAGGAPAGLARRRRRSSAAWRASRCKRLPLPRLRLAGVARRVQHRRQHDGRPDRRQPDDRRRTSRASCTCRSTRCTSWRCTASQGRARHAGAPDHAAHRAAREAALTRSATQHPKETHMEDIVIVAAARTAVGKFGGTPAEDAAHPSSARAVVQGAARARRLPGDADRRGDHRPGADGRLRPEPGAPDRHQERACRRACRR